MSPDRSPVVTAAEGLVRAGHFEQAIEGFLKFVREQPDDWTTATTLADRFLTAADLAAIEGRSNEAIAYFTVVANWLLARGHQRGSVELRARIERLELADIESQIEEAGARTTSREHPQASSAPSRPTQDTDVKRQAARARAQVARGDAAAAAEELTPDMVDGDPTLLLTVAEIYLRGGKLDQGITLAERAITEDSSRGEAVVRLGIEMAARQPEAGFLLVEMAADSWSAQGQWLAAAAAFEEFVARAPSHEPALVRLRELEAVALPKADEKRVVLPFRPSSAPVKSRSA